MQCSVFLLLLVFLLSTQTSMCSADERGSFAVRVNARKLIGVVVKVPRIGGVRQTRYRGAGAAGAGTSSSKSSLAIGIKASSLQLWGSLLSCLIFFLFQLLPFFSFFFTCIVAFFMDLVFARVLCCRNMYGGDFAYFCHDFDQELSVIFLSVY